MCGIAGFLEANNARNAAAMQALVRTMAARLAHRGPDGEGSWAEPASGIALGHRRLAILDLSPAGHQPMHSASGRYVISFNGEVYNYLSLRKELESEAPLVLRGHSDTEVLLAAFERWGVQRTLPRLEGMFAIALWDRQERALWLARDRVGKKPLYYAQFGSSLLFASELKALCVHPSFQAEIDPDAAAAYFRFGYVPAPLAIYRGVHKLPAGCWLRVPAGTDGRDCLPQCYWSFEEQLRHGLSSPFAGSEREAMDELDLRLRAAVRSRMVASDVPVGLFLSGGIDSSVVTALAQAESAVPVQTFSIGMSSPEYDESPYAERIARHLGASHTAFVLTPQASMSALRELPEIYDEPFADSSAIPTLMVSRLARRQVTVALSGDGGDELFGGYNRHRMAASLWPVLLRLPRRLRLLAAHALAEPALPALRLLDGAQGMLPRRLRLANLADKLHKISRALEAGGSRDLYLRLISCWPRPEEIVRLRPTSAWMPPPLLEWLGVDWLSGAPPAVAMMLADARLYMHDDILVKVDRASMAASLELRSPFLDPAVIELAMALPLSMKLRHGEGKWLVRRLLDRYVPGELMRRPKMGFAIPLDAWLRGPLRDWAEGLLGSGDLYACGVIDPAAARRLWSEFLGGAGGLTDQLWCLLSFQAWLQAWPRAQLPGGEAQALPPHLDSSAACPPPMF